MFNQVLTRSFQIGEKILHLLAPANINTDDLKFLGMELIKFAGQLEDQMKAEQPKPDLPVEDPKPSE